MRESRITFEGKAVELKKIRPTLSNKIKKRIMDKCGSKCQGCGIKLTHGIPYEFHHIFPYSYWPEKFESTTNILLLCKKCHNKIHGGNRSNYKR